MINFFKTLILGAVLIASCNAVAQEAEITEDEDFENTEQKVVIAQKTDEQIKSEDRNVPENWNEMSMADQEKYAVKMLEDRFILTTMNFKIITSGRTRICTFNVILNNNSSRQINKINVKYSWGESSTFASFGDVAPQTASIGTISMVGDVCTRITRGADYETTTCDVEGLSEEQCKLRVYPVK